MSNKDVAAKYGVQKNTLSTWVKNKEKILDWLEKGSNIKRQKLGTNSFEMVDKAIFNWFLSMWSQNVPLSVKRRPLIKRRHLHLPKNEMLKISKHQRIKCWKPRSIRWLVTTSEGQKPHNFQDYIRGIKICCTRNGWWVVGNVSSDSFIKLRA